MALAQKVFTQFQDDLVHIGHHRNILIQKLGIARERATFSCFRSAPMSPANTMRCQ